MATPGASFPSPAAQPNPARDVAVFPELTLTGYPPRDLLEKQNFLDQTEQHLDALAAETAHLNLAIICGTVTRTGSSSGNPIYNTAAVLEAGKIVFRQNKMLLPSYDVFDETRYFEPAPKQYPLTLCGAPTALTICEDAWNDKQFWERRLYSRDPVEELAQTGARTLISINASPYHMGKRAHCAAKSSPPPRAASTSPSSTSTRSAATTNWFSMAAASP